MRCNRLKTSWKETGSLTILRKSISTWLKSSVRKGRKRRRLNMLKSGMGEMATIKKTLRGRIKV
jgi:hypothetical protein